MRLRSHLLLVLALLCAGPALATQSIDAIQAAAEAFVRAQLPEHGPKHYVSAARLDPRLRLADCPVALAAFAQNSSATAAKTTVGVRCEAANQWTVYVSVAVEVEVPVLVLRRTLARRARVGLADVEAQVRRLPGSAASFVQDTASLQGHRLKRSLTAGTALTVDMLVPDVLVRRGQQVTLIAAHGPVMIRAQGQALSEGGIDDRVRVQNVTSLKVIEGVVESAEIVRVGL